MIMVRAKIHSFYKGIVAFIEAISAIHMYSLRQPLEAVYSSQVIIQQLLQLKQSYKLFVHTT